MAFTKLTLNFAQGELLINLGANAMNQDNAHAHGVQHGNILNEVLQLIKVLGELTRKGDHKGLLAKGVDIGRYLA